MGHWTSHAFHATVVSPRMMYEDVTMDFGDGLVTFTGRPLRNWRAWAWVGWAVRLVVLAGGVVALVSVVLSTGSVPAIDPSLLLRMGAVVVVWVLCLWIVGWMFRRYAQATRASASEWVSKLPVGDVSMAKLSGRTLSVRAPFDQRNGSDRWRLKVDSHDQGESLLALLGRR
jgi:hypothetical protein